VAAAQPLGALGTSSRQRVRESASGFTLIELLVVVAIIAVLAAMLLPALQRAKAMGRQATCISNLKQLIMFTHLYVDENEDYFPHSRMETYNMPPGSPSWDVCWLRFAWVYAKHQQVFFCPTGDKDTQYGTPGANAAFGHYGANTPSVFQYNPTFSPTYKPVRRSSIANPAKRFAIFDSGVYYCYQCEALNACYNPWGSYVPGAPGNGPNNYDGNGNDWPRKRHPTGVCVAFVDGHVEAWDIVKFANQTDSWW
jgi:prepilin-type N-terminal cleavage/methylation domain-containing protein/prepilin-type processing-associated H-X9-DG protein